MHSRLQLVSLLRDFHQAWIIRSSKYGNLNSCMSQVGGGLWVKVFTPSMCIRKEEIFSPLIVHNSIQVDNTIDETIQTLLIQLAINIIDSNNDQYHSRRLFAFPSPARLHHMNNCPSYTDLSEMEHSIACLICLALSFAHHLALLFVLVKLHPWNQGFQSIQYSMEVLYYEWEP